MPAASGGIRLGFSLQTSTMSYSFACDLRTEELGFGGRFTCEVELVFWNAVVVEHTPVALEWAGKNALPVLVEEAE